MTDGNDDTVVIRLALPDEREVLEDLQRRASLVSETYREALAANPDAIELPAAQIAAGEVWVAEIDKAIAGFCVVLMRTASEAELDGLFVEPDLWRRGIGTKLVQHAARIAGLQGATLLTVIASSEAQTFYSTQGFVVQGEVPTRFDIAIAMSRPLG